MDISFSENDGVAADLDSASILGASGCRILVTLLYAMKSRDAHKGLATLCIGGGQGTALIVER